MLLESSDSEGGLGTVAHLKLGQHVRHVVLDRLEADAECPGGLGVAAILRDLDHT